MSESDFDPGTIKINGKLYLTLIGFNQLRLHVGLEPLRPMPGEAVEDFKARYREARATLFRDHPELNGSFAEES